MENSMQPERPEKMQELWNDLHHYQKIERETVEALKDIFKVTTGKIEPHIVHALRKVGVMDKIETHDKKFERLFKQLTQSLSGLIHLDDKIK